MGSKPLISAFLNFLAENPDKEAEFDKHPVRVMKEFGLDSAQRELIQHGKLKQIRKAVKDELGQQNIEVFMIKMK